MTVCARACVSYARGRCSPCQMCEHAHACARVYMHVCMCCACVRASTRVAFACNRLLQLHCLAAHSPTDLIEAHTVDVERHVAQHDVAHVAHGNGDELAGWQLFGREEAQPCEHVHPHPREYLQQHRRGC